MAKQSKLELALKFLVDRGPIGQARAEIGFLIERLRGLRDAAGGVFSFIKGVSSTFFMPLKALAVPAIGAVTAAFGVLLKSVKEFSGQELGETDVKSAMKAMGQYTDEYYKKIKALADQYQETTGIADDMWLSSFSQLTRFGMTSDNYVQVTGALKNLVGLMDGNLPAAADAMARALQGEFSMFSRYGMKVEQTGDKVKDFENLLSQINTRGKGALEDRAATIAYRWNGIRNTISDTFEGIGARFVDGFGLGKWLDRAKGKIKELQTSIGSGSLGKALEEAAESFSKKLNDGFKWLSDLKKKFDESGQGLGEGVQNALMAAVQVFGNALLASIQASLSVWKVIGKTIFSAFKEELLKADVPGLGGFGGKNRKAWAIHNAKQMDDASAAKLLFDNNLISRDDLTNPVFQKKGFWGQNLATAISEGSLNRDVEAKIGAMSSAREMEDGFKTAQQELASVWGGFSVSTKSAVEKAATGTPGQGEVRRKEGEASRLEQEIKGFADMAAQLPEGKAREAALALQQAAQMRLAESQTLLDLLRKGGDVQAEINAQMQRKLARLESQVAAGRG